MCESNKWRSHIAPKKSRANGENVPPSLAAMVLSTPDASEHPPATRYDAPPLSPSKRRQATSHYNDGESSPSKRRVYTSSQCELEPQVRGMLFAARESPKIIEMDPFDDMQAAVNDLSMQSPPRKSTSRPTVKDAPVKGSQLRRTRSRKAVFVDLGVS